jgi:hypothetical protein
MLLTRCPDPAGFQSVSLKHNAVRTAIVAGKRSPHVLVDKGGALRESENGFSQHSVRCSDMSGIGGQTRSGWRTLTPARLNPMRH